MSVGTKVIPRTLCANDIPAAMRLSAEAGWNQTSDDWRTLIELSPAGCFAIEVDGELASTTTLLCYGKQLAWVGMVLTKVAFRGRGFARRLLTAALTLADQLQIASVKLDATDQGQPLYEKLGFRCEQAVERWMRPLAVDRPTATAPEMPFVDHWCNRDPTAFGVDRSALLHKLAQRQPPLCSGSSYLLTRPGRTTRYFGPCVAGDPEDARGLMQCAIASFPSMECSWDLLPENKSAITIARDLRFSPKRHLMRMVRGKDLRGQEEAIYAIAGFELG